RGDGGAEEPAAEALAVLGRPPQQGPDDRGVGGPGTVMIDREWQGGAPADAQHRRNPGIEQVGLTDFGVAEHLPQPEQGPDQGFARPAAFPLDETELALDLEIVP